MAHEDLRKRLNTISVITNSMPNSMLISETIEFPGSLLLFCLPSSFVCLSSWPFRKWYCFRAQISPVKQSSGWPKVYEDYYIQECWPSKETSSWWCLIYIYIFFFGRVGGIFFSPSVACSNSLQVLETHRLCPIDHCTFLLIRCL